MHIATVSSKNQITIPVKLLRSLGIKPGMRLLVEKKKDVFTATPIKKSIVDEVAGSLSKYVPASRRHVPFEKIRGITQTEAAKYLAEKYGLPKPQK